jgi:hypothetical protein
LYGFAIYSDISGLAQNLDYLDWKMGPCSRAAAGLEAQLVTTAGDTTTRSPKNKATKAKTKKGAKKGSHGDEGSGQEHEAAKKDRKKDKKTAEHLLPTATTPATATAAAEPLSAREWQPTRSALLSSGARETGVKVGDHIPGQGLL